ncbi:DUF2945 domain-containing protein [Streptomyces sp. NPDC001568]|uniref:DUF2945 domain-containing protein n=1 Tax=Streptomyces sp. NPDC001568 TaxID=3364588 RepID=UPI0036797357
MTRHDDDPHQGDEVSWKSHGRRVRGEVKRRITERTRSSGRTVAASPEEPQYEVESDGTGRTAVHKPGALRRESGG